MGSTSVDDQKKIRTDFQNLLQSTSQKTYEERKNLYFSGKANVHELWQMEAFQHYYDSELHTVVNTKAGRWNLSK